MKDHKGTSCMICPACKTDVVGPAKFCSNCGADMSSQNDKKSRAEFTIDWVKEIFSSEGYEVGDITEGERGKGFLAKHKGHPNVYVEYRSTISVLKFDTSWSLSKAPGILERLQFFKTVNSMNSETIGCQCSVSENDLSTLTVQFYFYVTESVTRFDITSFNDFCRQICSKVLNNPRIQKFA